MTEAKARRWLTQQCGDGGGQDMMIFLLCIMAGIVLWFMIGRMIFPTAEAPDTPRAEPDQLVFADDTTNLSADRVLTWSAARDRVTFSATYPPTTQVCVDGRGA